MIVSDLVMTLMNEFRVDLCSRQVAENSCVCRSYFRQRAWIEPTVVVGGSCAQLLLVRSGKEQAVYL